MKTTVEISEDLAQAVRRLAVEENTSFRALIEAGLRRILEERQERPEFHLRDASFRGEGLRPPFQGAGWERVREAAYGPEAGG